MSRPALEIIAHRGLHDQVRENTIAAFERALAADCRAIELDVHATADGVLVVHHDYAIPANGSETVIAASTLEAAQSGATRSGYELPTLSDVLDAFTGRAKLYIEVKALGIELLVARAVRLTECEVAIHSFDHRVVKTIRDFVPGIQTGVLTVSRPVSPAALLRDAGATDYWPNLDFVDADLVSEIHEAGGRVIVWTANHPHEWERLVNVGVDAICTNHPDKLRSWMQREGGQSS